MTYFPYSLSLITMRGEITVTREQDEGADLRPGEHQLDGVDGEPDVGRVFLIGAERGGEDQVDRGLRQRYDVLRVSSPVGIGSLDRHLALDDVAAEQGLQLFGEVGSECRG